MFDLMVIVFSFSCVKCACILAYLKFSVKVIPLRMACKRRCGVWMTVDGCGPRMYFR